MSWRKRVAVVVLLAMLLGTLPAVAGARPQQDPRDKVDARVLEALARDGKAEFLVFLSAQADLSGAALLSTREEKGWYVYRALKEVAERTQVDLRASLDARGVPYRAYYIRNMIWVCSADAGVLLEIARRPEVDHIEANPWVHGISEPPAAAADEQLPAAPEWNVVKVRAPEAWALGYRGQGAVVAGNDTGIDWDHPALVNHYRPQFPGYGRHDFNWHDAISNQQVPYDDHGHGTHTAGTMVGDDGGTNQVGVAPGAYFIGCKNMSSGGVGSPATYIECFEFLLAPYPWNDPGGADPAKAPDVINNSWGCPPDEGCSADTLEPAVQALRAAGIEVVVSAGNAGSACSTVEDPPAIYRQSFSVGATDSNDNIASFSSRGPVTYGGETYLKPEISAPGVNIRSSVPGGGYAGGWSGTSMAGPHVAGEVALLLSACPALAGNPDAIEAVITSTALPRPSSQCGPSGPPNNVYGWGRIDALAGVQAALALCGGMGRLEGNVSDAASSAPIVGATVSATRSDGWQRSEETDAGGAYTMTLPHGTYTVTAAAFAYFSQTVTGVGIVTDTVTVLDFDLDPLPAYIVSGTVTAAGSGAPLSAQVEVVGTPIPPEATNPSTGFYSLTVPQGSYTLHVTAAGYAPQDRDIVADHDQTQDFQLYLFCDVFTDTVENGNLGWTPGGSPNTWAITAESSHSPSHSWTDSPGGNYTDNTDNYISSPVFDLSGYSGTSLSFWHIYNTEASYDYALVEYSTNGGGSWSEAASWDGTISNWEYVELSLPALDGQAQARIRFHFTSDTSVTRDGWHVDDIVLSGGGPGCAPPPPPVAGFLSNSPVVDGQSAVFTNTTTGLGPIEYLWQFGDGVTSTLENPTHLYPTYGSYTVTLEASNVGGSDTLSQPFLVTCRPVSDVQAAWTPPVPLAGAPITFTGSAAGSEPLSFAWDLGDGTLLTGTTVTHAYTTPGDYVVALAVANPCSDPQVVSQTLHVCDLVRDAGFTWSPAQPAPGNPVTFSATASSADPLSYDWDFGDGSLGSGITATHTYTAAGTYTVTMLASNDCGAYAAASQAVVVQPCDSVAIVSATYDIAGCTVDFSVEVTGTAPFTYLWEFGDGTTSTLQQPTHSYTATGTYSVTVSAYNCSSGQDHRDLVVTVECIPVFTVYLPLVYKAGP